MTKIFHQTCYLIKNKFFLIITLFLFITSLSGIAFSETKTSNENSLYEQRNEKEAFKWYKKAAEQGNKEIFYQLEALAKKNNPALSALKVVAKKGNSEAQLYLGFYYSDQENKQETVKWFTKSAEQRNDSAQYYLGKYYYEQGDEQEAFKWYKKAAENGKDLYNLQSLAENGNSKALSTLKTLAENGNGNAQYHLGEYYHKLIHKQSYSENYQKITKEIRNSASDDRKNFEQKDLSLSELKQEAFKWYKKAAENGNGNAQYFLWKYYYEQGDEQEASKWYTKAFEQKTDAASSILTALASVEGLSEIKKSADKINSDVWLSILKILAGRYSHKALFEIEKLAEQGNDEAQYFMGNHYYGDQFSPRLDEQKAVKWFKKAADKGNPKAQCWLARYYKADAVKWYTKAAEQGYDSAFSGLQTLAKKGKSEALSVLKSFAKKGNEWAQFYLGDYYYDPKYEEPGFVIY